VKISLTENVIILDQRKECNDRAIFCLFCALSMPVGANQGVSAFLILNVEMSIVIMRNSVFVSYVGVKT
jgi:hypothetical protein